MAKFDSLSIEHFRTFRKRQELPLSGLGFVLIRGDNRVSQAANDNGAGKTGILHALCWALYGKDLDGLGADDVACRFTKGQTVVSAAWFDGPVSYGVTRTRRPAGLAFMRNGEDTAAGKDQRDVQTAVAQALGYGYDTFRHAVVFSQSDFDRFSRASQEDRMRMLDEIQGLDFRAALDRAKRWRDEHQGKADSARRDLEAEDGRRRLLTEQAEEYERARDRFAEDKERDVKDAAAKLDASAAALIRDRRRIKEIEALAAQAKKLRQARAQALALEEAEQGAVDAAARLEMSVPVFRRRLEGLEKQVADLRKAGKCPTCRQAVAEGGLKAGFGADVKAVKAELKAVEAAVGVAQKALAEVKAEREAGPRVTEREVAEVEAQCSPAALDRARELMADAGRVVAEREEEVSAARGRKWDGASVLEKLRKDLAVSENTAKAKKAELERSERALVVANYWTEAFGDRGIRSLLVDSVADFLNGRLAEHLSALTAGEADVVVSALTALKSGQKKERLSLEASWAWGAGGASQRGSAGQDRRVDLAMFAALQDLAESRSARPFSLRAFDEPFDALDSRGKEMAVAWARGLARKAGTAFLITHDEYISGMADFDVTWTVVLDRDGGRVEVG